MNDNEKLEALSAPFDQSDVKYRIQTVSGDNALVLPYVSSRAIQERLDNVLGVMNWRDEYTEWQRAPVQLDPMASTNAAAVLSGDYANKAIAAFTKNYYQKGVRCILSIKIGKEWISKQDGSSQTDISPIKGGFSGALKRTAVKFGMGRYLYSLPPLWVKVSTTRDNSKESAYHSGSYQYFSKPDLTQYTGQPTEKKVETKSATEKVKEAGTVPIIDAEEIGGAPTAISTAEFRDWQTRLGPLAQNNPTAQQMIGLSAKESDSMGKVSKLLGACYNLFAVGSKEQADIATAMQEKSLPDMVLCLKNSLIALESK